MLGCFLYGLEIDVLQEHEDVHVKCVTADLHIFFVVGLLSSFTWHKLPLCSYDV